LGTHHPDDDDGVFSVYNFFQYFLKDVIGVANPAQVGSALLGVAALVSLPFGFLAGILSDRIGRKRMVMLSGGLMAATSIIYVMIALHASWFWTALLAVAFGIGNCAYQTVDWALAIDACRPWIQLVRTWGSGILRLSFQRYLPLPFPVSSWQN
jgi:MFS family permease